jgi:predicted dehydrogenase
MEVGQPFKDMKKKRILLIGAGQLGSRHLQALAALHEEAIIEVVDPTRENLEIAKKRFEQISGFEKHYLNLHDSIASLDKTAVNLAIIATNSSVRSEVIKELLNHLQVKFMVLEKFLFQKAKEYSEIGNLLNEKGVVTYVNCTRRLFVDYQKIKNSITGAKVVYMDVVGNEWGLGCNGVHFIDLFQWLSNQDVPNGLLI